MLIPISLRLRELSKTHSHSNSSRHSRGHRLWVDGYRGFLQRRCSGESEAHARFPDPLSLQRGLVCAHHWEAFMLLLL